MSLPIPRGNSEDAGKPAPAIALFPKGHPAHGAVALSGKDSRGRLTPAGISAEFAKLSSSPRGLTTAEAEHRLEQYGPNAIKAHEESALAQAAAIFLGADPLDDRGGGDHLARPAGLGRLQRYYSAFSSTTPRSASGRTTRPRARSPR